ncbi:hypothetical protein LCGC14_1871920 [marine sediment metagenome]|uniref:Uncharacterized protein n=1 Tax=marine sediment metagenome TaxID=412755 RepID=A0A0F9IIS5_9ZZZZ
MLVKNDSFKVEPKMEHLKMRKALSNVNMK